MAEGMTTRVKRLIAGSAADLVDRVETARGGSVMREAMREIEAMIEDARTDLVRVATRRAQAQRHAAMTRGKIEDLTGKARAAIADGRDDLAEAAVSRLLDLEQQVPALEEVMRLAQDEAAEIERRIAVLDGRLKDMAADHHAFLAARRAVEQDLGAAAEAPSVAVDRRADHASRAFDRAMRSAGGLATAKGADDAETRAKLAELDAVLRDKKRGERLAALKAGG